ncbi:MAG: hypothetical protein ACOZNI_28785 [Myxococcota bacterium]
MPEIRHATVLESTPLGPGYHTFVLESETPLGARPGQWAAFWSDIPNPAKPGEPYKRAWSFTELDGDRRFRLLVATVGLCTRWLVEQPVGARIRFTGPWGSRFLLDEGDAPASFFATGSGISPVGALVDACVARGRKARLYWETSEVPIRARVARWRSAGVEVDVAPRLDPEGDGTWWLAGDGGRIDEVVPRLGGTAIVERFFTPRPA